MEDNNLTMADLMDEVEKSFIRIRKGDMKNAKVVSVEENGVVVNIGYVTDGIVPWNEYAFGAVDKTSVKEGDEFEVIVLHLDNEEGNVVVSKKRAEAETSLENIQALVDSKKPFTVKPAEVVKGGLVADLYGLRAFIPASQITDTYVEDVKAYVGKELLVEVIEFVPKTRKIVLSGRALAKAKRAEAKKERLAQITEGEKYEGTVTKLMPYGAFIDLQGIEGLAHNTDLSWTRIKHPSDVVKEGQKVIVTVLSVDQEAGKIALRVKDIAMDPWYLEVANLEVGQILTGTVSKCMNFGAFVRISDHVEGLVHISQISDKRISKPEEAVEVGQEVKVKLLGIDKENKRISLSMTQVEEVVEEEMVEFIEQEQPSATMGDLLGDTFKDLFK